MMSRVPTFPEVTASRKLGAVHRLSWRRIAFWFLVAITAALQCVVFADLWYGRRQSANLLGNWLTAAISIGGLGLLLAEDRYARQVARRRAARQAHASVGID